MDLLRRRRRPALPDDVATALGIAPRDVLAWSPVTGGGFAVATREGLGVITPRGAVVRRAWTDVHHAAWQAEAGALAIWWVGSTAATPLEVEDPSRLPDVVHACVTDSVVMASEVEVPGGRTVWVALRKGGDGALFPQAVPRRGVDLEDPEVRRVVDRASRELREQAGLL